MGVEVLQQAELREFGEGLRCRLILRQQRVEADRDFGEIGIGLIADLLGQQVRARFQAQAVLFETLL